jgi:hypothetical protein
LLHWLLRTSRSLIARARMTPAVGTLVLLIGLNLLGYRADLSC